MLFQSIFALLKLDHRSAIVGHVRQPFDRKTARLFRCTIIKILAIFDRIYENQTIFAFQFNTKIFQRRQTQFERANFSKTPAACMQRKTNDWLLCSNFDLKIDKKSESFLAKNKFEQFWRNLMNFDANWFLFIQNVTP